MYNFFGFEQSVSDNNWQGRIGASDKTVAAYFYKFVGTTLTSHSPIPMEIRTSYWVTDVGSAERLPCNVASGVTLESGGSIVLWSDINTVYTGNMLGTTYTCHIPPEQRGVWTFDTTGKDDVSSKQVVLASWSVETGFNDSDIPARAEIPTPTKRLYKVAINVESSINHVILDNADVQAGYLFYCINDNEWHTFSGAASASLELPYGTTIKLAKKYHYNMPGFTYNSDAVSTTR